MYRCYCCCKLGRELARFVEPLDSVAELANTETVVIAIQPAAAWKQGLPADEIVVGPGYDTTVAVSVEEGIAVDSALEHAAVAGPVRNYCSKMLHLGLLGQARTGRSLWEAEVGLVGLL